jgi:hypothetical protein
MGRIQCTRLAGSAGAEVVQEFTTGASFHGLMINVIAFGTSVFLNGGTDPFEVRVYADNTGTTTGNLIWRQQIQYNHTLAAGDRTYINNPAEWGCRFTEGIYCAKGLRVEIDRLTAANLEVFILHS